MPSRGFGLGLGGSSPEAIARFLNRDRSNAVKVGGLDFHDDVKVKVVPDPSAKKAIVEFTNNVKPEIKIDRQAVDANVKRITHSLSGGAWIPVSFLTELGKAFTANQSTVTKQPAFKEGTIRGRDVTGKNYDTSRITSLVNRIQNAYYLHYVGLLESMDGLVQNPGIAAVGNDAKGSRGTTSFNKTVRFVPQSKVGNLTKLPETAINLQGEWPTLSELTMEKKASLGNKVFWNHTGEAATAFHAAVASRLAYIRPHHFMESGRTAPQLVGGSSGATGAGQYVAQATFKFKLGIPSWNNKMDTLITKPFATRRTNVSTLTGTGVSDNGKDKHRNWQSGTKGKELRGIDRLLVAEAYRPWLRSLSAQAGSALQRYVNGSSTTANQNQGAKGIYQKAQATFKKAKEQDLAQRKTDTANKRSHTSLHDPSSRLFKDRVRAEEKARKSALTPAQRRQEEAAKLNDKIRKAAELRVKKDIAAAERRSTAGRTATKTATTGAGTSARAPKKSTAQQLKARENKKRRNSIEDQQRLVGGVAPAKVPTAKKVATPSRAKTNPNSPVRAKNKPAPITYTHPLTGKPVTKKALDKHNNDLFKEAETSFNVRAAGMVRAGNVKGLTALLATNDGISDAGKAGFIEMARANKKK